ncbi:unnamed protein product [Caenorhabditis angaria]|uniref:Uncharacterized protein n=1 Tax=Caenorhabditis angaria TaxID=860376 RepID=A0A9P1IKQ1_9PELO|nr:unnamed protein product [Caenorhabditis angaria]
MNTMKCLLLLFHLNLFICIHTDEKYDIAQNLALRFDRMSTIQDSQVVSDNFSVDGSFRYFPVSILSEDSFNRRTLIMHAQMWKKAI